MRKQTSAAAPAINKEGFLAREGTKTVIASVFSILIGMIVGSIIILIVGLTTPAISLKGAIEGLRLVFIGILSTGRDASGALTFGFNPVNVGDMLFRATPIILTGLSVAVAFKTGLFNIGAPGQYLMGTAGTLYVALSIPRALYGVLRSLPAFSRVRSGARFRVCSRHFSTSTRSLPASCPTGSRQALSPGSLT